MKIDRLLGIITILLQCNKTTAPELAERFEVSRRTIHRDIDDICSAGIPIVTSHYKSSLSEKISLLKTAILETRLVSFDYYSEKGLSKRTIEPYYITFRWTSWYIFGYCRDKGDFRLFKLNRLWRHKLLKEEFMLRKIPADELQFDDYFTDEKRIIVLFDSSMEYKLVEEYGPDCYTADGDGKLRYSGGYTNREHIIAWILGFGDKAKVIEPADIAAEIRARVKNIISNYEHDI